MFFVFISARTAANFVGFLIAAAVFIGIWHAVGRAIHGSGGANHGIAANADSRRLYSPARLQVGESIAEVAKRLGLHPGQRGQSFRFRYSGDCVLIFKHGRLSKKIGCG